MNCQWVQQRLWLYAAGDLEGTEARAVEEHLRTCAGCRRELALDQRMLAEVRRLAPEPPAELLEWCRSDLVQALTQPARSPRSTVWGGLQPKLARLRWAVIAAGFWACGLLTGWVLWNPAGRPQPAAVVQGPAQVVDLESIAPGRLRVRLEETSERVLEGSLNDPRIRQGLLQASRNPVDAGVRARAVDLLAKLRDWEPARQELLYAARHDPHDGVRWRALAALEPLAGHEPVRDTLAELVLTDPNPGLRAKALEVLLRQPGPGLNDILVVALEQEQNQYIRWRAWQALNARQADWEGR